MHNNQFPINNKNTRFFNFLVLCAWTGVKCSFRGGVRSFCGVGRKFRSWARSESKGEEKQSDRREWREWGKTASSEADWALRSPSRSRPHFPTLDHSWFNWDRPRIRPYSHEDVCICALRMSNLLAPNVHEYGPQTINSIGCRRVTSIFPKKMILPPQKKYCISTHTFQTPLKCTDVQ